MNFDNYTNSKSFPHFLAETFSSRRRYIKCLSLSLKRILDLQFACGRRPRNYLSCCYCSTPTLMAFTGVSNAHGPSPQPTAYSLTTATGSNQA